MNTQIEFNKEQQLADIQSLLLQSKYPAELETYFIEYSNLKFEKNLKAFRKYFPEIYEKYLTYQPSEKFRLFPNKNGTANILDYDCLVPIYSEDPILQCEEQVSKNIKHPILGKTDHSSVEKIENVADFRHVDLMRSIGRIYNEAKNSLENFNQLGESVPSIMVFGIGLGYHLPGIVSATRSGFVSFFEPNEDYFFASLFVADWDFILNRLNDNGSYLYLGIGLTETEIYEQFYSRTRKISIASICHAWFYQHYPSQNVNKWIEEFKSNYHQFFTGFGFFDDAIIGIANTLGNLENNLPLLTKHNLNDTTLEDFPVFILANGPSLDSEIEYIKSVQEHVVIMSCNSATTALIKHGIIPDFHVALERTEFTYHFLKNNIPQEFLEKLNLLTTNVMHPNVAGLFSWSGAGLKPGEAATQIIQLSQYKIKHQVFNTLSFCNPLVGNTALSFACHLGFKNIYLFGVDNGYIEPEHHHSKSSFYYDDKGNTKVTPMKMGKEFKVAGNFNQTVITDPFLYVGNVQMGRLLESFKSKGINCFNCSNGARINNSIPLASSDIILHRASNLAKGSIVEYIKAEKFSVSATKDEVSECLEFENFESFCLTLVSIIEKPVETREEALFVLLESIRYIYSFKDSADFFVIYLLMEGEALYVTTIFISLLYNFGASDEVLPYYNRALEEWINFLKKAPYYYSNFYNVPK